MSLRSKNDSDSLVHDTSFHLELAVEAGYPNLVLRDNPEDKVGREVGGGFRIEGHMYTCGQLMLMYGKNHHNSYPPIKINKLIF